MNDESDVVDLSPVDVVTRMLTSLVGGDTTTALTYFAADAVLEPAHVPSLPFTTPRRGIGEIAEFFEAFGAAVSTELAGEPTVVAEGSHVVVLAPLHVELRRSDRSYDLSAALAFDVLDGYVTSYRIFEDTLAIEHAVVPHEREQDVGRLTDAFHRAFLDRDVDALDRFWHPAIRYRGPTGSIVGAEARSAIDRPVMAALDEITIDVKQRTISGAVVAEENILSGRHVGPFVADGLEVAPSGRVVSLHYTQIVTWSDGLVVDQVISFDRLALIEQLTASE